MKKLLTALVALSTLLTSTAGPRQISPQAFGKYCENIATRSLTIDNSWQKDILGSKSAPQRLVTETDGVVGPASYWGSLFTPEGEEWMYLAQFETEPLTEYSETIKSAVITIYDADFNEYKSFSTQFELREGETSINTVQVAPTLSRKFFNINDAFEVMLYVHATTEDYTGANRTYVYTLSDGSMVDCFEGNNIASVDTSTNSWSENYTMIFMREETVLGDELDENGYPQYSYMLYFDVYQKAGWGTGATLAHTFEIDYQYISGSGDAALPILVNTHDGKISYMLPRYEKPYFVSQWTDDVTPDNFFILDLYDSNFELVKTTRIPMELEGDAIFSFPGIGGFRGFDDLCYDYTFGAEPVYIVGVENYITSIDDFSTSLYIYDLDGNRINTIVENADDFVGMSDIEGYEKQWCFLFQTENNVIFRMIDFPSMNEQAVIPVVQDNVTLSTSLDRVPVGNSYKYVSSILTADVDDTNNVLHKFAWLNADGSIDRFDRINLGNKVIMAQAYVAADGFNPFLFNTDNRYEYMFLVKEPISPDSPRANEYLRVYSDDSRMLLNLGPNDETGEKLNSIFLANTHNNKTKLVVTYYKDNAYNIHHIDLPFTQLSGGDGTLDSPYQIQTPGDLLSIYLHPSAHYVLTDNIDFKSQPVHGNKCAFTGSIDGNGYKVENLNLVDGALISEMYENATVKNIQFNNVTITSNADKTIGVLVGESMSNSDNNIQMSNVVINGLTVNGNNNDVFGGLIGHASLYSRLVDCAVVNANINLPRASAGGLVGIIATSSRLENCFFDGAINARVAGGIAAESFTGDETISNCHVKADISAKSVAGGIIGESARTFVNHCYTEGSVSAISATSPCAGGIVGQLKTVYVNDPPVIINDNIVASEISVNADAANGVAHRIAGFTSIDEKVVDWDSKDPNVDWSDPSTYPYLPGKPELYLKNNYAIGIERIDADIDDDPDTTEGASIDEITEAFLTVGEWLLGDDTQAPWAINGSGMSLWFEERAYLALTDVFGNTAAKITYNGESVIAKGLIEIYDTAGMLVAKGTDSVNVRHLTTGIYIARTATTTAKFVK